MELIVRGQPDSVLALAELGQTDFILHYGSFRVRGGTHDRPGVVVTTLSGAEFLRVEPGKPLRLTLDPLNVPHIDVGKRAKKRDDADAAAADNDERPRKKHKGDDAAAMTNEDAAAAARRAEKNRKRREREAAKRQVTAESPLS